MTTLPRVSTHIPALDFVLGGSLPIGVTVLIVGTAGSGKTTLLAELERAMPGFTSRFVPGRRYDTDIVLADAADPDDKCGSPRRIVGKTVIATSNEHSHDHSGDDIVLDMRMARHKNGIYELTCTKNSFGEDGRRAMYRLRGGRIEWNSDMGVRSDGGAR